jgi:hypothetical protein
VKREVVGEFVKVKTSAIKKECNHGHSHTTHSLSRKPKAFDVLFHGAVIVQATVWKFKGSMLAPRGTGPPAAGRELQVNHR